MDSKAIRPMIPTDQMQHTQAVEEDPVGTPSASADARIACCRRWLRHMQRCGRCKPESALHILIQEPQGVEILSLVRRRQKLYEMAGFGEPRRNVDSCGLGRQTRMDSQTMIVNAGTRSGIAFTASGCAAKQTFSPTTLCETCSPGKKPNTESIRRHRLMLTV